MSETQLFGMIPRPKFGQRPSSPENIRRSLKFGSYITPALPAPPPRVDWTRGFRFDWGMALNGPNSYAPLGAPAGVGDCTEAKKVHIIQTWTLCNGRMKNIPDSVTAAAYELDGSYVPGDPSTDNGEDMISNLNAWRKNGFGGVPLTAYASVNPQTFAHVQLAIYLFGGVDIGFNVPQSAVDQNNAGQTWSPIPNDGGIVGGHDVVVVMYDAIKRLLGCLTWGGFQLMTPEFFAKYVTECYALLSPVWINQRGVDPSGFAMNQLQSDLAAVTG